MGPVGVHLGSVRGAYPVTWDDFGCPQNDSSLLYERNLLENLNLEVPELVDCLE
jgi:hypothetical protein